MMYKELVARLRDRARREDEYYYHGGDVINEAADAIEELNRYVQQIEKLRREGWYLQKTKMMTYGNATMTMPLPKPPKEE